MDSEPSATDTSARARKRRAAAVTSVAAEQIAQSGIKEFIITDTVERHLDALPKNAKIISVAPLFAEAIRSIHDRTSVSRLFGRE